MAMALVFATTNCLPLCSPYAQDGQLFNIVRVEEQNQGLDNPSNPPCWCRSKCNSRTNADRHLPPKHCESAKWNPRGRGMKGGGEEGDKEEEEEVTHDATRETG
jgi:hypothetical protein